VGGYVGKSASRIDDVERWCGLRNADEDGYVELHGDGDG
jgi:hypothetical protein